MRRQSVRLLHDQLTREQVLDSLDRFRTAPDALVLKRGGHAEIVRVPLPGPCRSVVVRRYNLQTTKARLEHLVRMDKAARMLRASPRVARAGIRTPRIHARVAEGPPCRRHHVSLVCEDIAGCLPLPLYYPNLEPARRTPFLKAAITFLRHVHDAGLYMTDMVKNIEVATPRAHDGWEFWFFDLDKVYQRPGLHLRRRRRDVVRLLQYAAVSDRAVITALREQYVRKPLRPLWRRTGPTAERWLSIDALAEQAAHTRSMPSPSAKPRLFLASATDNSVR